ncbi:MAG TPA: Ig-like domain-containing protein [Gemmatales bacterium]|nr:Ig-like domain-containing protein [Gemmatales bacterium]
MSEKRRRFVPSFDRLEERTVPAGNVTAKVAFGVLTITGDESANSISLVGSAGGKVTISSGSDATTINGNSTPVTLKGFNTVNINMNDGDDTVDISQFSVNRDINILLGAGNDALTMDRFTAGIDSGIWGQDGNDSIFINHSAFQKKLSLNSGLGDDTVTTLNSSFGRSTLITGVGGTDTRNAYKVSYGSNSFINGFETTTNGSTPIAKNDTASVNQGSSVSINVAANDLALNSTLNLTSIVITQAPTHGSTVINNDGTVTYTNDGKAWPNDTFSYTIKNSSGTVSAAATVKITINPVDQAPKAVDDNVSVVRTATKNISVAANDTDVENQLDFTTITFTLLPTHGTISLNPNGTVKYINDGNAATSDTFKYTIKDLAGNISNEATVTLTITANVSPTAVADAATVAEGSTVTVKVASNDTDSDGTLDLTSIVITQQPAHGSLVVNNDGTVKYTHDGSETTTDSFKYTIKDNVGATSNAATVTITVTAVNDAPVATDDTSTVAEGGTVIINVAGNDTDADGTIDLTSIAVTHDPTHGTFVIHNDGTVTYTHDGSETTSDSFKYTIKDNLGKISNEGTVNITVTPVNDPPHATGDTATIAQGGIKKINLAGNDTDADGTLDLSSIDIVLAPTHGMLVKNGDGTVTYIHDGSNTLPDSASYTIKDNNGDVSNVAKIEITVVGGDMAPVASPDMASLAAGASTIIDLKANDSDSDGTIDPTTIVITTPPTNGTLTIHDDGTVTYTHNGSATTSDSFSYTIRDNLGLTSNITTVAITIL